MESQTCPTNPSIHGKRNNLRGRGNVKPFGKRLSPSAEMPNLSGNDFRRARKCQTLRETTFAMRGRLKLSCNDIYKNSQILQTQKVICGSFKILLYYKFNMENDYSKGTALNPLRRPKLLDVEKLVLLICML